MRSELLNYFEKNRSNALVLYIHRMYNVLVHLRRRSLKTRSSPEVPRRGELIGAYERAAPLVRRMTEGEQGQNNTTEPERENAHNPNNGE